MFANALPTTSATKPHLVDPDLIGLGGLLVGDGGLLTHGGNDGDEELVKGAKKRGWNRRYEYLVSLKNRLRAYMQFIGDD